VFFFEKKNQKTFVRLVPRKVPMIRQLMKAIEQKFFGSFFQKRTLFFLLFVSPAAAAPPHKIHVGALTLWHCIDEYDGYCGKITQPLDRHGGDAGTIEVGFEYYPHTDTSVPSAGVILAQEGGPGFSTTGSRDGYVRMLAPLRDHRDILLMDKRGTGRSSPINCPALQNAYLPTQHDVAACADQLGGTAWFYRSADAADDLAAVMAALQTGPADYYGDSYATWFGQVFAVLHPDLLHTLVLDSAYPVLNDNSNSEVNAGQKAMDIVCRRSAPCAVLPGSATSRFATLLESLRKRPVSGVAPGAAGVKRRVTADPEGLFLIIADAGDAPTIWRDLDAAGRAWLGAGNALPLLRLIAESRDSYAGGGSAYEFSVGLADAVQCAEYGNFFSLYASRATRLTQYHAGLKALVEDDPGAFAPFTMHDAIFSQMDVEQYDTCLTWPKPVEDIVPGQPIPPGSVFPAVPTLVLSGQLDTVTSPSEGRAVARLFPNATYIETPNMVHESAIGDAGYFVPPNGEDLSRCIGPIVRAFMLSGGSLGDTKCLAGIRPIRTVPAFAVRYTDVTPANPAPGNQADQTGLTLASAVAETVGDAVARYYVAYNGVDIGLYGGNFTINPISTGYTLTLLDYEWTKDVRVSGNVMWNQVSGDITGTVTFAAGTHSGTVTIDWNDRQTEAVAALSGTIDGANLAATRLAP
jgi:pimeloyl-ACP methyl ester carboxylesterase